LAGRIRSKTSPNSSSRKSINETSTVKFESLNKRAASKQAVRHISGHCLCGAVEIEIDFPAFWAWHDHSAASRRAHGAAYATYIGCWRKHVRIVKGQRIIARFEDVQTESTRSFCSRCGAPLLYKRKGSPHIVNIPRALFTCRTGREPRYHVAIEELQDWTYTGSQLVPLKGYPGIVRERPKSRRRPRHIDVEFAGRRVPPARNRIVGEGIFVPKI
jgi:hypothetical protein